MKTLRYETRDADGNDIVKNVTVKEFASAEAEGRGYQNPYAEAARTAAPPRNKKFSIFAKNKAR